MRGALVLPLLFVAACTQPRSETCKTVCAKEYECITQTNSTMLFDEKECVAACSVLEGDPDNLAKVKKHADCIARANLSCSQLLQCE